MMFLLGYDIGSSSIKATLIDAETGRTAATGLYPPREMAILSKKAGWAEQDPEMWWKNLKTATGIIRKKTGKKLKKVAAIGISYQMHGLVCVDRKHRPLRPSIIWCDSRAVPYGEKAAKKIGLKKCLSTLLNYPGNFTAAKLAWVKANEPALYKRIYKIMLPGDYIAMKLSGEIFTSYSGLSEGILWDFKKGKLSDDVLNAFGINRKIIADSVPSFSACGAVIKKAAKELGIPEGAKISYRAGDQPNNALSLNVLEPGELATTAGTSGVVYGVSDKLLYDPKSRVNTFVHVNHSESKPRYGTLMCLNGTGILNSWLKNNIGAGTGYDMMNTLAAKVKPGSEGLMIHPYGNGAERNLENRDPGALVSGLSFTAHSKEHFFRAGQEGIVYALNYGIEIMKDMGIRVKKVKAGKANMFLSPVFRQIFAAVTGATVEMYETDGSGGAARGAGIGAGIFKNPKPAFKGLKHLGTTRPSKKLKEIYKQEYAKWKKKMFEYI